MRNVNIDEQISKYQKYQERVNFRWDSTQLETMQLLERYAADPFSLCHNSYKLGFMAGMRAAKADAKRRRTR